LFGLVFFSFSGLSQTRKVKTKSEIDLQSTDSGKVNKLVPERLFLPFDTVVKPDSSSIAEILFNPELKLIDPDTFKLELSLVTPDSSLLNRDSSRIIDVHPQDAIRANVFKLETKNKQASLIFYGSIRVNGAMDYNGLQSVDAFNTYYIPVGEQNSNVRRFYMSASQTRFGILGNNKTSFGPVNFKVEADFRGKYRTLRIRHAYGQFINILAGQTWSVFGDPFAIPWTVDLEGPNSSVNQRAVQIRYSNLVNEKFRYMVSIETPQVEFVPSDSIVSIYQGFPDLAARMKFMMKKGHFQAAFIIRSLGVKNASDQSTESMGVGGLLSGRYDIKKRRTLLFQVVGGKGIARYISSLKGTGSDVVLNPATNRYEPLPVFGGFVSFAWGWNDHLYSFLTPGFTSIKNKDFQEDDAFSFSAYFSVNTFFDITEGFRFGAEYSYGSRVNKDTEMGSANRLSIIFYYSF
jgi:hypothetical protein